MSQPDNSADQDIPVNSVASAAKESVVRWLFPKELDQSNMSEEKSSSPEVAKEDQEPLVKDEASEVDSEKKEKGMTEELSKQVTAGANYVGGILSSAWSKTQQAAASGVTASSSLLSFASADSTEEKETNGNEETPAKEESASEEGSGFLAAAWSKVGSLTKAATYGTDSVDKEDEKKETESADGDKKDQNGAGIFGDLSGIVKVAADATAAIKEKVGQSTNMINEFNREQEEFIKSKAPDEHVSVAPWVGYKDEEALMAKILSLSGDKRTFVRAPPSGVTFDFDYSSVSSVALTLLKEDANLNKMRYELVPKVVSEDNFWKNYFYRVNLIKQSFDLKDFDKTDEVVIVKKTNADTIESRLAPDEDLNKDSNSAHGAEDEFVSDSYQLSSKDMAEVDESMKRLGVGGSGSGSGDGSGGGDGGEDEWEAELEGELNEFEVVSSKDGREDSPEWENQIQEMLDAEDVAK